MNVMKNNLLLPLIIFMLIINITFSADFFISPKGDDNNPGTINSPFLTLEKARDTLRSSKKLKNETTTIWLKGGRYHRKDTFELKEIDSGTKGAPVIFKALPGEKVYIDGGIIIPNNLPKLLTSNEILKKIIPEARDKILEIDLKIYGINDYGEFGPRGFSRPILPSPAELFVNGHPQKISRWPNDYKITLGKVINKGSTPRWGDKTFIGGTFKYEDQRIERWIHANDAYISGHFAQSWADDTIKIANINIENNTITTVQPHLYGFENKSFTSWYVVNLLEEIDTPGEYFIDKNSMHLYFYPDSNKFKVIQISQLKLPIIKLSNTSNIYFENIIFENSRGNGIEIEGGEFNKIKGCTIRMLGGIGMSIAGGATHSITSCNIYYTGAGGILLRGGNRKTLTPSNHLVKNCDIYKVNRWYHTYKPCIKLTGVGHKIINNHLHDVPGQAIIFGGNDHKIEFNEIDHCVTDMSDMGSIYTGRDPSFMGNIIRYNFFHHIVDKSKARHGVHAIYIDDDSLYTAIIYGNIFYKVGSKGVIHFNGGGGSSIGNNIAIDCSLFIRGGDKKDVDRAIGEMISPKRYKSSPFPKKIFENVDISNEPFKSRYPYLLDSYENGFNYGTPQWNNVLINGEDFITISQFVDPENLNFALKPDASILKITSKNIYDRVFGLDHEDIKFKKIPFEKIGLYKDEYRVVFPKK